MSFHAGTVGLIGRPNAGKSTLLNALVGAKISAVSRRPQTTRTRVAGVYTTDTLQAVLWDTPGIHEAFTPLNNYMVREAEQVLDDVDCVCWIVDALPLARNAEKGKDVLDPGLLAVLDRVKGRKLVIALNKVDAVDKQWLLPVIGALGQANSPIVPISASKSQGLDALVAEWEKVLPEQPALYPPEHVTDALERQICAELIRERVFENTDQEVPYATAVEIEQFDESARETEGIVRIHARILVEKPSQKAILIGKGGAMIKKIGTEARRQIADLLDCKVRLDLFVVVEKDWTTNPRHLKGLGYA
ncbi:MAG: GTPase Era [Myxococcota bacterium]